MATYKVLQDIEAEDKLVGPLTLRQCIYAAIAILNGWLSFLVISKGAPYVAVIFLPFIVMGVFFAIPWSKQQSTEVWALAKIRFALKPRRRIWDQSGVKDLVTVTAPKKVEGPQIRDITETEVRSRLKALADTIDSRGWAVKNVDMGAYPQPYLFASASDRLVDASSMPQPVPDTTTTASDDMFDYSNNPVAQQFNDKITAAESAHRQQLMDIMKNPPMAEQTAVPAPVAAPNYWYLDQPQAQQPAPAAQAAAFTSATPPTSLGWGVPQAANPTPEEEALAQEIRRKQEMLENQPSHSHIKTIQPLSVQAAQVAATPQVPQVPTPATDQQAVQATPVTNMAQDMQQTAATPAQNTQQPVTPTSNTAILELANNNDLNVATIAREAQQRNPDASGEVVVKLH